MADRARIRGDAAAPIWIVEVSDFQCPYCRMWQQETYPQLDREYIATGKVKLAYVHLPIPNHQHAMATAEASMCAAAQGRFWEMHDRIFATQERWSRLPSVRALLDSMAGAVGVDLEPWRECLDGGAMRPLIQSDYDRAVRSGATSTPTFLIMGDSTIANGGPAMLVGAQPIENFRPVIDEMLARRTVPPPGRE